MICTSFRPLFEDTTCSQASKFARRLLMPESAVRELIDKRGIKNIGELAEEFGVPATQTKIRVLELGYKMKNDY